LRTGDANLRFCITNVKDEWRKPAFLTRAWFPRTSVHNTRSVSPNGPLGRMFEETWRHSELKIYDKYWGKNTRPQCVNMVTKKLQNIPINFTVCAYNSFSTLDGYSFNLIWGNFTKIWHISDLFKTGHHIFLGASWT
jgi:hypothetical protein